MLASTNGTRSTYRTYWKGKTIITRDMIFDRIVGDIRQNQIVILVGTEESGNPFHSCGPDVRVIQNFLESFLYTGIWSISETHHLRAGSGYPIGCPILIISDDIPAQIPVRGYYEGLGFDDI